ncbi:cation transporter [Apiospora arundinis]
MLKYNVFLLQSIGNNRLYVNKILREGEGADFEGSVPPEFRVSTRGLSNNLPYDEEGRYIGGDDSDSDSDDQDDDDGGGDKSKTGSDKNLDEENTNNFTFDLAREPYFPELVHWQKLRGANGKTVYSLYHEFYNGGSLAKLIERYSKNSMRVPEHFIWRVAEQIGEALAWLYFGRPRGSPDATKDRESWRRAYHLDMYAHNIWLNYPPPATGRKTKGERANAFPNIVIGDFGESYVEGNPKPRRRLRGHGRWPATPLKDIDGLSDTLRRLALVNYDEDVSDDGSDDGGYDESYDVVKGGYGNRFDNCKVREVINLEKNGNGPPYSEELIDILETLAWKRDKYDIALSWHERDDGGHGWDDLPDIDWVVNTMLPKARDQVARRSSELAEGTDYRDMDVSWTKPILEPIPWLCSYNKSLGIKQLNQLDSWLGPYSDVCPKYELQRLLFGAPKLVPMGYGDASAELAQRIFADRYDFGIRGLETGKGEPRKRPSPSDEQEGAEKDDGGDGDGNGGGGGGGGEDNGSPSKRQKSV